MTFSPLDSPIHQFILLVVSLLLCAFGVGAIAGVLIQKFGKRFARSLWRLLRTRISQQTMQVLIVEDNPDSRETLKRYLTRRDYDVAAAGDLRAGIKFLNKGRFDAIISDIFLPDGTGYTLINEARRLGMSALGIAMSGYPYPSNVDEPGVTGFDYHFTKPVNCDHLCTLLNKKTVSMGTVVRE